MAQRLAVAKAAPFLLLAAAAGISIDFVELKVIVGAPFRLGVDGRDLTWEDKVVLVDAGTQCPGPEAQNPRSSIAVASTVCYQDGACEPSPLYSGFPRVERGARPGWQLASFFPVQLRLRGSFRICYCSAESERAKKGSIGASPCSSKAMFGLVGVVYSLGIDFTNVQPIRTCLVGRDGRLVSPCNVSVSSGRGGLSHMDRIQWIPDSLYEICGEATPLGPAIAPIKSTGTQTRFSLPFDERVMSTRSLRLADHQGIKLCYCEHQTSANKSGVCGQGRWQLVGYVTLAGFAGPSGGAPTSLCYRGHLCTAGPSLGFGLGAGDRALVMPNRECRIAGQATVSSPVVTHVVNGRTTAKVSAFHADSTGFAAVCYCAAVATGVSQCARGEPSSFVLLLGYLQVAGLEGFMTLSCVPKSSSCPEHRMQLQTSNQKAASNGKVYATEATSAPCENIAAERLTYVEMIPTVRMPWPMPPGRYDLCFCDLGLGCPDQTLRGSSKVEMQNVGTLIVRGSIKSVTIVDDVGLVTIPLSVQLVEAVQGFECCASLKGNSFDRSRAACRQVIAQNGPLLPSLSAHRLSVVVDRHAFVAMPAIYSIQCRALQESGPCAAAAAPCMMPPDGLNVELGALPLTWQNPWFLVIGTSINITSLALAAGPRAQIKVVSYTNTSETRCIGAALADVVSRLPCREVQCRSQVPATAQRPGSFWMCICESPAVTPNGDCVQWYPLAELHVSGPDQWRENKRIHADSPQWITLTGRGLSQRDRIACVRGDLVSDACSHPQLLNFELTSPNVTVYSPALWSGTSLSVKVQLALGIHTICWIPDLADHRPHFVGTAFVLQDINSCIVTAWENVTDCSAPCGTGAQRWQRRVVSSPPTGQCPALQEVRSCQGPPCPPIERWKVFPEQPMFSDPMELLIHGQSLPDALQAFLFQHDGKQSKCIPGMYESAGQANCNGTMEHVGCRFTAGLDAPGWYEICLCQQDLLNDCVGFFPSLGEILVASLQQSKRSTLVIYIAPTCAVLAAVLVLLLLFRQRRTIISQVVFHLCGSSHAAAKVHASDGSVALPEGTMDQKNLRNAAQPEPEPPLLLQESVAVAVSQVSSANSSPRSSSKCSESSSSGPPTCSSPSSASLADPSEQQTQTSHIVSLSVGAKETGVQIAMPTAAHLSTDSMGCTHSDRKFSSAKADKQLAADTHSKRPQGGTALIVMPGPCVPAAPDAKDDFVGCPDWTDAKVTKHADPVPEVAQDLHAPSCSSWPFDYDQSETDDNPKQAGKICQLGGDEKSVKNGGIKTSIVDSSQTSVGHAPENGNFCTLQTTEDMVINAEHKNAKLEPAHSKPSSMSPPICPSDQATNSKVVEAATAFTSATAAEDKMDDDDDESCHPRLVRPRRLAPLEHQRMSALDQEDTSFDTDARKAGCAIMDSGNVLLWKGKRAGTRKPGTMTPPKPSIASSSTSTTPREGLG